MVKIICLQEINTLQCKKSVFGEMEKDREEAHKKMQVSLSAL